MIELTPVAQILHLARAYLREEKNWTQGYWGKLRGMPVSIEGLRAADCFCLDGAIQCAAKVLKLDEHLRPAERALLSLTGGYARNNLWDWNDSPDRKFSDVTALLEAAILAERSKGN